MVKKYKGGGLRTGFNLSSSSPTRRKKKKFSNKLTKSKANPKSNSKYSSKRRVTFTQDEQLVIKKGIIEPIINGIDKLFESHNKNGKGPKPVTTEFYKDSTMVVKQLKKMDTKKLIKSLNAVFKKQIGKPHIKNIRKEQSGGGGKEGYECDSVSDCTEGKCVNNGCECKQISDYDSNKYCVPDHGSKSSIPQALVITRRPRDETPQHAFQQPYVLPQSAILSGGPQHTTSTSSQSPPILDTQYTSSLTAQEAETLIDKTGEKSIFKMQNQILKTSNVAKLIQRRMESDSSTANDIATMMSALQQLNATNVQCLLSIQRQQMAATILSRQMNIAENRNWHERFWLTVRELQKHMYTAFALAGSYYVIYTFKAAGNVITTSFGQFLRIIFLAILGSFVSIANAVTSKIPFVGQAVDDDYASKQWDGMVEALKQTRAYTSISNEASNLQYGTTLTAFVILSFFFLGAFHFIRLCSTMVEFSFMGCRISSRAQQGSVAELLRECNVRYENEIGRRSDAFNEAETQRTTAMHMSQRLRNRHQTRIGTQQPESGQLEGGEHKGPRRLQDRKKQSGGSKHNHSHTRRRYRKQRRKHTCRKRRRKHTRCRRRRKNYNLRKRKTHHRRR